MLCLSRKREERLNIYQTTPEGKRLLGSLLVLHASHGSTRLGFELSSDIVIVREEIDDAKPLPVESPA